MNDTQDSHMSPDAGNGSVSADRIYLRISAQIKEAGILRLYFPIISGHSW